MARRVKVRGLWWTVVGVARDGKHFSFTEPPQPHFYVPFRQWYLQGQNIVFFVRAKGEPERAIGGLRAAVAGIDPNAAGFSALAMAERNSMLLIPIKLTTSMLSTLGAIALLLAGVGLYGVISYAVSQRTRELGIRMALGARPRELLTSVAGKGMALTGIGVSCGLALSVLSMQGLAKLLVDVSPFDPPTFAGAAGFLVFVGAAASFVPARRASRVAPIEALRAE